MKHFTLQLVLDPESNSARFAIQIPDEMNGPAINTLDEGMREFLMVFATGLKQIEIQAQKQKYNYLMEINGKIVVDRSGQDN